jgi:hypothetical protein
MIGRDAPLGDEAYDLSLRVLYRLMSLLGDTEKVDFFLKEIIPQFGVWLLDSKVQLTEGRGLLSLVPVKEKRLGQTYDGYLDFVRTKFSEKFVKKLPKDIRHCSKEELELSAALLQLSQRPRDSYGLEYVKSYMQEVERKDLERRIEQANEDADFYLEKLKPYITRYRDIAKRPRNPKLKEILSRLVVEINSTDPKVLWLSLIRKFNDTDREICDFFDDLVPDDSGLSTQNSLKEAPYKFVYMDSVQSGATKGREKYLTYSRFRYHLKKLKK